MWINGQQADGTIDDVIAGLQSAGTGFAERTKYTGKYFSRGESERLREQLEKIIDDEIRNGKTNPLSLNMRPVVVEAHRVEGGEVGFSANDSIGTDNTHDCVTVMLRDPVTKKTALAHVGGDTTEESLQILWEGMTQSGRPIEMRLLGGRQLPITVPEDHPEYPYQVKNNQIARWNVEKVVRFFQDKPVNVLSADILTANQPAAVVVNPATFRIEEKVPGRHNPNTFMNGLSVLYTGNFLDEGPDGHNPLMKAFDLTVSPERNPVQLTPQQLARLSTFVAADHQQIEDYFRGKGRTGFALDQAVERVEALCAACAVAPEGVSTAQGTGQFTGNPRNRPGVVRGRVR